MIVLKPFLKIVRRLKNRAVNYKYTDLNYKKLQINPLFYLKLTIKYLIYNG